MVDRKESSKGGQMGQSLATMMVMHLENPMVSLRVALMEFAMVGPKAFATADLMELLMVDRKVFLMVDRKVLSTVDRKVFSTVDRKESSKAGL